MALGVADYRTRIDSDLAILGTFSTTQKNNIIMDALSEFCRLADPLISASLSITANTTTYSIPATIRKIAFLKDDDGNEEAYTLNEFTREITLEDTPASDATFTVYGIPLNIRTNYETIIASMTVGGDNEECGDVLWQFVVARAHRLVNSDRAAEEATTARVLLKEMRYSKNRNDDVISQVVQFKDAQGQVIDDLSNAEGRTVDIDDFLESDLG